MSRAGAIAAVVCALAALPACSWDWDSVEPLHDGDAASSDATSTDAPSIDAPPPMCGGDGQRCCASGAACTGVAQCNAGTCAPCAAGEMVCGGRCVNLQTDDNNCGRCGQNCRGFRRCVAGVCM